MKNPRCDEKEASSLTIIMSTNRGPDVGWRWKREREEGKKNFYVEVIENLGYGRMNISPFLKAMLMLLTSRIFNASTARRKTTRNHLRGSTDRETKKNCARKIREI